MTRRFAFNGSNSSQQQQPPRPSAESLKNTMTNGASTQGNQQKKSMLEQMREDAAMRPQLEARISALEDELSEQDDLQEQLAAVRTTNDELMASLRKAEEKLKAANTRADNLYQILSFAYGVLSVVGKGLDIDDSVAYVRSGMDKNVA